MFFTLAYLVFLPILFVNSLEVGILNIKDIQKSPVYSEIQEKETTLLYNINSSHALVSHKSNFPKKHALNITRHLSKFHYNSPTDKILVLAVEDPDVIVKEVNKKLFIPIKKIHRIKHHFDEGQHLFSIKFTHDWQKYQNTTIKELSDHPSVLWIDFDRPAKVHDYEATPLLTGFSASEFQGWGVDEIVTVGDTGVDINSCYFKGSNPIKLTFDPESANDLLNSVSRIPTEGKVAAIVNMHFNDGEEMHLTDFDDKINGHGTWVCGAAAGDDSKCNMTNHAPISNSRLIVFDFEGKNANNSLEIPTLITPLMQFSYEAGSRIFTNSWGTDSALYTLTSMEIDWFTYIHDDYMVIFAAGNSGPEPSTIGSPATFKNGISVGASQNTFKSFHEATQGLWEMRKMKLNQSDVETRYSLYNEGNLCGFSSRGPTLDGRIKPDIVAPGEYLLSARSHGSVKWPSLLMRGTSMATPKVADMVALIRYVMRAKYKHSPSWALMKNILIVSAVKLTGQSDDLKYNPDTGMIEGKLITDELTMMDYGWGRVSLKDFINDKYAWYDRVELNSYVAPMRYCWTADVSGQVSIGLVWPDPPGYMRARKTIMNNLDLRIIIIDSNGVFKGIYYGNNGLVPDNTNTVEKITVHVSAGDTITAIINGNGRLITRHPIKVQTFSLVFPKHLQTIECSEDCTEWDPPYECITTSHEYGQRKCQNGRYSGICYPLCGEHEILSEGKCICNTHIPCISKNTHLPAFEKCYNGKRANCTEETQIHEYKLKSRVLTARVETETVHYNTWFIIMFSSMSIAAVFIYISFK